MKWILEEWREDEGAGRWVKTGTGPYTDDVVIGCILGHIQHGWHLDRVGTDVIQFCLPDDHERYEQYPFKVHRFKRVAAS